MNPVDEHAGNSHDIVTPDEVVSEPDEVTEVIEPGLTLIDDDESEIDRLQSQLRDTEARLRTVSAAYKVLQGDQNAFQKRIERQQDLKLEVHKGENVAKLFNPLENLRRSIDAAKKAGVDGPVMEGLEMVHRSFMEGFEKLGLTEVATKGAAFDPLYHEALSVVPVPTAAQDGLILEVFAQGYRVGSRLIRPARVVVAQARPVPAASEE